MFSLPIVRIGQNHQPSVLDLLLVRFLSLEKELLVTSSKPLIFHDSEFPAASALRTEPS
jgi:hypothetical protein